MNYFTRRSILFPSILSLLRKHTTQHDEAELLMIEGVLWTAFVFFSKSLPSILFYSLALFVLAFPVPYSLLSFVAHQRISIPLSHLLASPLLLAAGGCPCCSAKNKGRGWKTWNSADFLNPRRSGESDEHDSGLEDAIQHQLFG